MDIPSARILAQKVFEHRMFSAPVFTSSQSFENNIYDDVVDDTEDDLENKTNDTENGNAFEHRIPAKLSNIKLTDQTSTEKSLHSGRLSGTSNAIGDAKDKPVEGLDWDQFSCPGDVRHISFEDSLASNVNGMPDQNTFHDSSVIGASATKSVAGWQNTKRALSTNTSKQTTEFATHILKSEPTDDFGISRKSQTVDNNDPTARQDLHDHDDEKHNAIPSSPSKNPINTTSSVTQQQANKSAPNPDTVKPENEEPIVTGTGFVWVLTDKDLKGLSTYTGRRARDKRSRIVVSWDQNISADVSNAKLPPYTVISKIRPKSKYKTTLYFPLFHVAQLMNMDETEDDAILAHVTSVGFTEYVPCMQCYASGYSSVSGGGLDQEIPRNGKCQRCGVTLLSSLVVVKSLIRLRRMFQADNLIVQDVRNDGNCLFAAVVDQLRTQRILEHDIYSLREASVGYLRTHPFSDDGTRLDVFLVDETWEQYLLRMGRDGEWGDHMILNAMAEVLHMQIIIYGGIAKQQITRIVPKSCSYRAVKGDIRIAHLVESHYVSLREKDWIKKIDSLKDDGLEVERDDTKENVSFSVMHFDMIMNIIVMCEYLQSLTPTQVRLLKPPFSRSKDATMEFVGDLISEAIPVPYSGSMFEGILMSHFFSHRSNEKLMPVLYVPYDTRAQFEEIEAMSKDVVVVGNSAESRIQLRPLKPSLWKSQIRKSQGIAYLKTFEISVDIFPERCKTTILSTSRNAGLTAKCIIAFWCEWPECALEWVSRSRPSQFPSYDLVHSIYHTGCHVVPYLSQSENYEILGDCASDYGDDHDTHWCISFAISERILFTKLSREQNSSFLIFRAIVEQALDGHVLPSSIMKSVFLYACENLPQTDWKIKAGQCLLMLLRNIANAFSRGILAHYFISTRNMLHGLSQSVLRECGLELQKCWTRPMAALSHSLETLNIASSDIEPALSLILDDLPEFVAERNAERSFVNCYYPSYGYVIQIMVLNGEFEKAFTILQDVKTQFENVFARSTDIDSLVKSVLTGIDTCKTWVFALFTDLRLGTKISASICLDQPALHISEVFGPKATELLIDTVIPEGAKIENGNLMYAEAVIHALMQLKNDTAFIAALRYYLERYKECAGDNLVIPVRDDYALSNMIPAEMGILKSSGNMNYVSEYKVSMILVKLVGELHVELYNRCLAVGMLDQYRPLFPTYQAIAKLGLSDMCSRNERVMGSSLGIGESLSRLMGTDSMDQYMD